MSLEAWFSLAVVAAVTLCLMLTKLGADLVFMGGLVLLCLQVRSRLKRRLRGFQTRA